MKYTKYFSLIIPAILFQFFLNAQSNCIIAAQHFLELLKCNRDRTEEILMPCFIVRSIKDHPKNNQTSPGYIEYYREYSLNQDNLFNTESFKIYLDKRSVSYETADVSRYTIYKNSLKKSGFKFLKESDTITTYTKENLIMETILQKTDHGHFEYIIKITSDK